jgi:hypothetical protein
MEPQVLVSIVEHDAVHRAGLDDLPTEPVSVRADRHDGTGTALRDKEGFISGFFGHGTCPHAVGHEQSRLRTRSPVPAAKHGDALAFSQ